MGNPQNPGWYDDPQNPEQLRYFDGIIWTDHVTARATRAANGPGQAGAPNAAGGGLAGGSGSTPHGQQAPLPYGAQQSHGQSQYGQSQYGQSQYGQSQHGQSQYGQQPYGYAPAPQAPWQQVPMGPTTTDGQPLASWWSRVLAEILDSLILLVVNATLLGWLFVRAMRPFIEAFRDALGETDPEVMSEKLNRISADVMNYIDLPSYFTASVLALLIGLAYHVWFHGRKGATPGKMALGLAVRRPDRPGPVGYLVAAKRELISVAATVVAWVPFLGALASIVQILDVLWPLWDGRRQALHDKIADTQVVRTR